MSKNEVARRELLLAGGAALAGGALMSGKAEAAEGPPATFRRVVVGNAKNGTSIVISDEKMKPGEFWRSDTDALMGARGDGELVELLPASPTPREGAQTAGTRWYSAAIAPSKAAFDRATIKGWHRNKSMSYVTITNGEVMLVMDEGEIMLRGGDLLVMRNAMHTWHNATDVPVGMLIAQTMLG